MKDRFIMHKERLLVNHYHHQAIQFKLADMATRIEAARFGLQAALDKDSGRDYSISSAMAKVFASETLCGQQLRPCKFMVVMVCKRIPCGAHDAGCKITQIYEGTSEVQRIVIGRSLLIYLLFFSNFYRAKGSWSFWLSAHDDKRW
jgi:alkylation response protein AidB-like acyl-CoA dehydrogenase